MPPPKTNITKCGVKRCRQKAKYLVHGTLMCQKHWEEYSDDKTEEKK